MANMDLNKQYTNEWNTNFVVELINRICVAPFALI